MSPSSTAPPEVPSARPDPLVVVVAFHASDLLEQCLVSLGQGLDVVIVDNSSDPTVAAVARSHGCDYVDPGHNLGFAGGVNLGIARRGGRDVLLLNPDAAIGGGDVRALQAHLVASPDLAALAPAQTDPGGCREDRVAWPFPSPTGAWLEAVGLARLRRAVDFLIGSVLLLRAEALDAVGPFDDRFFLYAEESDWQRRAADRGWRVELWPAVSATHVGAGTGGDPQVREAHFQASHERYIRKHHGTAGWWSYRSATIVGSALRSLILPGERGARAGTRLRLFLSGPMRAEAALDHPGLHIVHVVVTDAFAGVERYICQVANGLAGRGHRVEVVGGETERMVAELDRSVLHHPASTVAMGAVALTGLRGADLVHAHMTAAEAAAALTHPVDRAPIVATRHFAADRGSSTGARIVARRAARSIEREIAISEFVARSVSESTVLVPNAVPDRPQAPLDAHQVVMLQRLDDEKSPDVGLRAWARSALPTGGWHLVIAGAGVLRPVLERLAETLGCSGSVTFAGLVADTDGLLSSSSILLAPAAAEPFGLSVVEAMSHGLAVVAARGGAHIETVGEDGLLFPPGEVDAAARCLNRLGDDPTLRRSVGEGLRRRQRERYSMDLHLDRLEAVYTEVVAGHVRTPTGIQARASARS